MWNDGKKKKKKEIRFLLKNLFSIDIFEISMHFYHYRWLLNDIWMSLWISHCSYFLSNLESLKIWKLIEIFLEFSYTIATRQKQISKFPLNIRNLKSSILYYSKLLDTKTLKNTIWFLIFRITFIFIAYQTFHHYCSKLFFQNTTQR